MAANDRERRDLDEALPVERFVARDSLSEWQLSKGGCRLESGTCGVGWRRRFRGRGRSGEQVGADSLQFPGRVVG